MRRSADPDVLLIRGVGDPVRLAILRQLAACDGVSACAFGDCCTVGQPTVSHHLKVLRDTGWVFAERSGSRVRYRIRPDAAERFRRIAGELAPVAVVRAMAPQATTVPSTSCDGRPVKLDVPAASPQPAAAAKTSASSPSTSRR
jgi:ArsR family transcriptional regulator